MIREKYPKSEIVTGAEQDLLFARAEIADTVAEVGVGKVVIAVFAAPGSIICASTGFLVIAAASSMIVTLIGAAVTGIGVAVVYPVALSIAAPRSDARFDGD
ncbi:hypothetical protein [Martelella mangrovi]|uniref:Uncharacterized protein n=1 Tax=Martelella mangrovi TaxID=1397477 RepID=A0ABV2IEJ2_9HYPH